MHFQDGCHFQDCCNDETSCVFHFPLLHWPFSWTEPNNTDIGLSEYTFRNIDMKYGIFMMPFHFFARLTQLVNFLCFSISFHWPFSCPILQSMHSALCPSVLFWSFIEYLQVTKFGEPVLSLGSEHKKPYECLILGTVGDKIKVPDNQSIVSVPCALHSRKPPLEGRNTAALFALFLLNTFWNTLFLLNTFWSASTFFLVSRFLTWEHPKTG